MGGKVWNIFDLSVSSLICNSLTNPQSMGLFGGFLMTAYAEKKAIIIDCQMVSPKNFELPIKNFSEVKAGPNSIAISGFLKGVWEIYKRYASLPWNEIIDPITELCRTGILLTKHLRDSVEMNDGYLGELFLDNKTGKIKRIGSRIIISKHCDFLDILAKHNQSENILSGEIGQILADDLSTVNNKITLEELRDYKVKIYDAKIVKITDEHAILVPDTSAILIPSILKILMRFNFNSTWFDSENNLNRSILLHHRIVETFKYVFALRPQLSDPDFIDTKNVTNYLLSNEFATHVIDSIDDLSTKNNPKDYGLNEVTPNNHGTSHISILAENGDAISVTSSINF